MDNSFLLDAMDWSYSRVNSFDQCPRMFYLTYLQCADRVDNAFAQWGTLVHSLLERYYREQVELWDLTSLYEKEYSKTVKERFPFPRLEDSYYERGIEYLNNFNGQIGDEEEILAVEDRYVSTLGGRPVVGVIDLIPRTKSGLIVCDHKSRGQWKSNAFFISASKCFSLLYCFCSPKTHSLSFEQRSQYFVPFCLRWS